MAKKRTWTKLDNAAKIFPPTSNNKDSKVFRFACQLKEDVEKSHLQRALDLTMKKFPFYRSILKKGVFWYYFEESHLRPMVYEESEPPCSPIYSPNDKNLLFNVSFFKKRINLEVFHALSDGTGALQFITTLVTNYLNLKYKRDGVNFKLDDYDASVSQMKMDGFSKYFSKVKVKRLKSPKAFRVKGEKFPNYRIGITEIIVPVSQVKTAAKSKDSTITEYLVALLIDSMGENMSVRDKKRPVSVSVPVNLRTYFPAKTSRNFFSVMNVLHDFNTQGHTLDEIISSVNQFLEENLNQDKLQERINLFASLENKLPAKLLPLFIKIPSLKVANRISDKAVTAACSNVGKVALPEGAEKYIDMFSVFTSTNKIQVTMCSFEDTMVITFTSPFTNSDIQCSFLDRLNDVGVNIKINSNIGEIG